MLKRILLAVGVLFVFIVLGAALVGNEIVSGGAGLAVWVVGIVAAVVLFFFTKPKEG